MGYRHRRMYNLTSLPGWIRFGFSPGWMERSPTGLPPTAQWILQSGLLPQYMQYLQSTTPTDQYTRIPPITGQKPASAPFTPSYTKEQEKQMLEQQVKVFEKQLESINKRLKELEKQEERG